MSRYKVSLIPGDGIGPELTKSASEILEFLNDNTNFKFEIIDVVAGDSALSKYGIACVYARAR